MKWANTAPSCAEVPWEAIVHEPTPWKTLWYPYAGGRVGIQLSIWKDLPIAVLATAVLAGGRSLDMPTSGKNWDVPFNGDDEPRPPALDCRRQGLKINPPG